METDRGPLVRLSARRERDFGGDHRRLSVLRMLADKDVRAPANYYCAACFAGS